jgi:hypothetical protein
MPSIVSNAALAAMPLAAAPTNPDPAAATAVTARLLLPDLERGRRIDAATLRAAMERTFGGSDADGTWDWKTAYDSCEAATVLFLRKFGPSIRGKAASPAAILPMLAKISKLLPTQPFRRRAPRPRPSERVIGRQTDRTRNGGWPAIFRRRPEEGPPLHREAK